MFPSRAGNKVMHDSQASGGNSANITAQPSPCPADDNHKMYSEETHESQTFLKIIENSDPLPLPDQVITSENRLYALIIGIDKYLALPKLSGAVNDAKAMEEFLRSRMNVQLERIHLLFDQDATRNGIIEAFEQLSEEEKIRPNDPILIYYAGHGALLPSPKNWEAGGTKRRIQGICPYDYAVGSVSAIPDRSIGDLLDFICEKKGNNITVIFDCCHSSSGTRLDEPSTNVRGVELDDELPLDLDRPESSVHMGRDYPTATKFGRRGLGSHVLVAACKEREFALEDPDSKRGQFTVALLELFNQEGRMETLTYTDILKHIGPIKGQNPQVEGIYRDRVIFDAKAIRRCPFYSVTFDATRDIFILEAGSLHGIAIGSQFTIYEDPDSFLKSYPLGSLLVSDVMEFTSLLPRSEGTSGIDLKKPAFAVLSAGGMGQALAMTASYGSNSVLPLVFRKAIERMERQRMISLVDINAEVEMRLQDDGNLAFHILDSAVNACGLDQVYHTTTQANTEDDIARILSAGCRFFWHLRRGHHHPIVDDIKVEFMELKEYNDNLEHTKYPFYSPTNQNLLKDGIIKLDVSLVPKPYGIRITNNSKWNLFPVAFYFDHSDWSVEEYYHPGTAGKFKPQSPLQKGGGTLTIGYGAGGHDPISFRLDREHQDLDVGHLKIFFSTKEADLRLIQQESPFTGTRKVEEKVSSDVSDTWVSLQYPIVQCRA